MERLNADRLDEARRSEASGHGEQTATSSVNRASTALEKRPPEAGLRRRAECWRLGSDRRRDKLSLVSRDRPDEGLNTRPRCMFGEAEIAESPVALRPAPLHDEPRRSRVTGETRHGRAVMRPYLRNKTAAVVECRVRGYGMSQRCSSVRKGDVVVLKFADEMVLRAGRIMCLLAWACGARCFAIALMQIIICVWPDAGLYT